MCCQKSGSRDIAWWLLVGGVTELPEYILLIVGLSIVLPIVFYLNASFFLNMGNTIGEGKDIYKDSMMLEQLVTYQETPRHTFREEHLYDNSEIIVSEDICHISTITGMREGERGFGYFYINEDQRTGDSEIYNNCHNSPLGGFHGDIFAFTELDIKSEEESKRAMIFVYELE